MGDTLEEIMEEADARLCSLRRLAGALAERAGPRRAAPRAAHDERAAALEALRLLHADLLRLAAAVAKSGAAEEARAPPPGRPRTWAKPGGWVEPPRPQAAHRRAVAVGGSGAAVDAVVLPEALRGRAEVYAQVVPGELYYVPSWGHFAFRLGSCVFHGNVGQIYPAGRGARAPQRLKDCRRPGCEAGGGCPYYHDPARFPGAADVRNYAASSWEYSPPAAPLRPGRHFGSAPSLEADLRAAGAEEARCRLDQVAHDVLCALLLWRHVLKER